MDLLANSKLKNIHETKQMCVPDLNTLNNILQHIVIKNWIQHCEKYKNPEVIFALTYFICQLHVLQENYSENILTLIDVDHFDLAY